MFEHLLISLSAVLVLGVSAQWLGWRLRLPSILLLLLFGILAGPVAGLIQPGEMLGPMLYPVVSLAVAVILFEGGLSLTLREFHAVGGAAIRLVTIGALVSWVLTAGAAHFILGLDRPLAVLLGAILVVTGPTVIIPMLREIRPAGSVGPILKWEGIVIDPIGAMLAVLVYEVVSSGDVPLPVLAGALSQTLLVGLLTGLAAAATMVWLLKRDWVPDYLQNPVTLMLVVVTYALANHLSAEAGLLAVTIMGFAMANQKFVDVHHIIEFKENLRVMLIASVFILLAASLRPGDLTSLGWTSAVFVVFLVLVVRPLAVFAATLATGMTLNEKLFLAWMAPRGIVAAAVSSIFALRLTETGNPGGETLVAVTFLVIITTVAVYGLTAGPLAKRLELVKAHPDGVLFLGGRFWVRRIAKFLKDEGFPVMIVDNSRHNVLAARMEGVPATYASVFSESVLDQVELGGLGKLLAVTSNDDSNSLVGLHFGRLFGRDQIFQLASEEEGANAEGGRHLRGRTLFGEGITHAMLTQRFLGDWALKKTKLSKEFDYKAFQERYHNGAIPLFLINEGKHLQVFNVESPPAPKEGQALISLVKPENKAETG